MGRLLALAVVALSCLVLAACSGGSLYPATPTPFQNGGGPTTETNNCALLTADDLNNIIPDQGFITGSEQGIYCNFEGQADLVDIGATPYASDDEAAAQLAQEEEASTGQKISDLGDDAYWEPENSDLIVVKGKIYLFLELFSNDDTDTQQSYAVSIAKVAVDHLP